MTYASTVNTFIDFLPRPPPVDKVNAPSPPLRSNPGSVTVFKCFSPPHKFPFKGELSDSFTNYNNVVGNTKVSVSIKKTYANKCTLSEIFLTEILKSISGF